MKAGAAIVTGLHALEMFLYEQIAKSKRINFDFQVTPEIFQTVSKPDSYQCVKGIKNTAPGKTQMWL